MKRHRSHQCLAPIIDRINRSPRWAREELSNLREQNRELGVLVRELRAENQRLQKRLEKR